MKVKANSEGTVSSGEQSDVLGRGEGNPPLFAKMRLLCQNKFHINLVKPMLTLIILSNKNFHDKK